MKNNETYERIEAYLLREMSDTERIIFEAEMQQNSTLAKQVKAQEMEIKVMEVLVEKDLRKRLKNWDAQIAEKPSPEMDIPEGIYPMWKKPGDKRPSMLGYWVRGGIAASLCLGLLGLGFGLYRLNEKIEHLAHANMELEQCIKEDLKKETDALVKSSMANALPEAIEKSDIKETLQEEMKTANTNLAAMIPTATERAETKAALKTEVKQELIAALKSELGVEIAAQIAQGFQKKEMRDIADAFMKNYDMAIADSRSSSENTLLKEGLDALEEKQYAEAIKKLTRYLPSDSDNLDVRYYLGMAHYLQGNFEQAIPHLRFIADGIHAYTRRTQWVLSLIYLKTEKLNTAKMLLHKIIKQENHSYRKKANELLFKLKEAGL